MRADKAIRTLAATWILLGVTAVAWAQAPGGVNGVLEFTTENDVAVDAAKVGDAGDDADESDAELGERGKGKVGIGDQLSFRQKQVHAEMTELEQRMFRLSEALKKLEPENSSRLIIGLKYARDELILHQMQEVQQALASLSLHGAAEEQKQVLAKLERLEQLLLSMDLDFEMRLERLRLIRQTLRELDNVIREESRQEHISQKAAEAEKELEKLSKRKATLQELVRQQSEHLEKNTPLAEAEALSETEKKSAGQLADAQEATRKATKALGDDLQDGATSKNLFGAEKNMQSAVGALKETAPAKAQPEMTAALEKLKQELAETSRQEAAAKQQLAEEKFAAMTKQQERNRNANGDVIEMARQLGSSGTAALSELISAGGDMAAAESAFDDGQAQGGNGQQDKALASLKYAKELLAEEAERLARQLRAEVKKRVMDGLAKMLEMQTGVRERTETLAGAVEERSREALTGLTALAKREEQITVTAQELINVVEETEFGIALPAALAAVRDATENVRLSLADGDASADVVRAEKQIEADLKAMLEVVSEMSDANSRRGRRGGNSQEDQRKELNRILSELKMIRLLELRVHQNTTDVDKKRGESAMSAPLRGQIEHLEGRQSDIQEATELLATERGDELPLDQ